MADKIFSHMANVISAPCDVISPSSEITNNAHFLMLFNKLSSISLQAKIGCALHGFMISGSMCTTPSPDNTGLVYVTIYTETNAILPHDNCSLCMATVIFKVKMITPAIIA